MEDKRYVLAAGAFYVQVRREGKPPYLGRRGLKELKESGCPHALCLSLQLPLQLCWETPSLSTLQPQAAVSSFCIGPFSSVRRSKKKKKKKKTWLLSKGCLFFLLKSQLTANNITLNALNDRKLFQKKHKTRNKSQLDQ